MHFTRIGTALLVLMDFADIMLPASKLLKYTHFQTITDYSFGIFFISWIITRHILYFYLLKSVIYESLELIEKKEWLPSEGNFYSLWVWRYFVALFVGLQILLLLWGWLILKVAVKVIIGEGADDVRSESDETEDIQERDANVGLISSSNNPTSN